MTICCSLTSNRRLREQTYPRPPTKCPQLDINTGERQKYILFTVLFNLYLHCAIRLIITHADDITILARNGLYLLELFTYVKEVDLVVNLSKTKFKLQSGTAGRRTPRDINIGEYHSNFTHEKISKSKLLWRTCKFRMYLRKKNSYTRNNPRLLQFNHREYVVKHLKATKT